MTHGLYFEALPQTAIPVVTIPSAVAVRPLVDALVEGGCKSLEITLRTEYGLSAIEYARNTYPDVVVGAGSVINAELWKQTIDHGGQFIVSPGATPLLYAQYAKQPIPWLPGAVNPSEMMLAMEHGLYHLKYFPAGVFGGYEAIKGYASVFPKLRFCPTGGIKAETGHTFLAHPSIFAVGGSWFTPQDLVDNCKWSDLQAHVEQIWAAWDDSLDNKSSQ